MPGFRWSAVFLLPLTWICGLLLAAQEPDTKPETQEPKVSEISGAAELQSLQDLSGRLLSHLNKICKARPCKVLINNFLLPQGDTSSYGIALADELSLQWKNNEQRIVVVDRTDLKNMFTNERIPVTTMSSDDAQRWLGKHFGADAILTGTTTKLEEGVVQLSVQFLSVKEKDKSGPMEETRLASADTNQDLNPTQFFSPLPPLDTSQFSEPVQNPHSRGVSMPSCTYTPNPSYTDDARQAKVSGSLLLEGVVDTDEKLKAVRVQRGMCCGLNQKSIQTLSTWKCKPGSYDGKPEPVLVMFEVNFRLY